jgi:hypothetical protein
MMRKTLGFAAILLAAGMISGCNQNQQKNADQKPAQEEFAHGGGGGHHGLRKICADDIQKFCANEDRKKRCLKNHMDQLSDACKAALAQHRGGRNRDKDDDNNNNSNDDDKD